MQTEKAFSVQVANSIELIFSCVADVLSALVFVKCFCVVLPDVGLSDERGVQTSVFWGKKKEKR